MSKQSEDRVNRLGWVSHRNRIGAVIGAILLSLAVGCQTGLVDRTAGQPAGALDGACFPNHTCNAGLICNSDNVCEEDGTDPCDGVDCGTHGACANLRDNPVCVCDDGYHADGLACEEDAGSPCEGQTCSGHGTCAVAEEQAVCVCDDGYHANGLACEEDAGSPCEGQTCSGHGTCAVAGEQAACVCDDGYHDVGLSCVEDSADNELRGIPAFPLDEVETPASGTVSVGASECIGTEASPASIVGGNWSGRWTLTARWCIIASVTTSSGRIDFANDSHHVSIRNAVVGNQVQQGGVLLTGDWMQIKDSHVHHNTGPDKHGVGAGCGSSNIFVTNNLIEYNGGDGFQAGHNCADNPITNVFFGGNTLNNNRENGFDTKGVENIVVSGNLFRAHRVAHANEPFTFDDGTKASIATSGSDGAAVVLGSDDAVGHTRRAFLFDNTYTDNVMAVRIEFVHDNSWVWGDHVLDAESAAYKFEKSALTTIVDVEIADTPCAVSMGWRPAVTVHVGHLTLSDVAGRICAHDSSIIGTVVDPATLTATDLEADYQTTFGWPL